MVLLLLFLLATIIVVGSILHKAAIIVVVDQIHPVDYWGIRVSDALKASGLQVRQGDMIQPLPNELAEDNQIITLIPASWLVFATAEQTHMLWRPPSTPRQEMDQLSIQLGSADEIWSSGLPIDPDQPLPYQPYRAYQVNRGSQIFLEIDGDQTIITSTAPTLGSALWEAGIQLMEADQLDPSPETWLNGQEINAELHRAKPIIIHFMGREIKELVVATSVAEALSAAGFTLQGLDTSLPPEDAPLPEDGHIRIDHFEEETIIEQEFIPFGIEYQPLNSLDLDSQQVVQAGEFGLVAQRVRVVTKNGEEISREVEEEWVAKEPKPRIIGYGTRINLRSVDTPEGPVQYYRAVEAYATSYSPCRIGVAGQCSDRTASGATLQKGVIGVIRSWYNAMKGTRVYIPGYGIATIEDIGAGVPGQHWVDLGYSDADWVGWSRVVTVYFLAPPPANILYILE